VADPVLHLLAGSNGAGKTTLFREVIEPITALEWVNADDIAAESGDDDPESAYRASRIAAERRSALIAERRSFATETVFSHPSKVDLVRAAVGQGYLVTLHVVLVPEELSVARVHSRVEHGGHHVPDAKIRERHRRLWVHVAEAITLAHETFVYDNTTAARPFRLVARFERGQLAGAAAWPAWAPPALRTIGEA
jgi:predicted ABC-type ATPase